MRLGIGNSIPSWSASSENFLFIWSAVCLQNTFWPIALRLLKTQKNYASQCVEHQKLIILYPKHFFVHQLFVYLLAKIKMKKERKFFFKNFRGPKYFFSDTFLSISRQAKKILNKTFYGGPSHGCPSIMCVYFSL